MREVTKILTRKMRALCLVGLQRLQVTHVMPYLNIHKTYISEQLAKVRPLRQPLALQAELLRLPQLLKIQERVKLKLLLRLRLRLPSRVMAVQVEMEVMLINALLEVALMEMEAILALSRPLVAVGGKEESKRTKRPSACKRPFLR